MFTVSSGFMGDFKLGDNINHNLEILALLYRQQASSGYHDSRLLCKPITLTIASICEAILSDFHGTVRDSVRSLRYRQWLDLPHGGFCV